MDLIVVPWAPGPLLRIAGCDLIDDGLRRRSGVPVDGSDSDVAALLDAYDAVCAEAPPDTPTISTAHTALLRTASLLRCAAPAGPAEREYVRRQTRAVAELLAGGEATWSLAYLRAAIDDR